ncbi:MAG TPA: hypothetical protein VD969_28775 [Symbiobacteriaceae bacterium]|nr:hypothetical protein [Symbiobacteriaceae bacterium]
MRRIVVGLAIVLMLFVATAAKAHNLSTVAAFSLQGDELTVRVMDVYGAAVEGATATVTAAPPDSRKKGPPATLKELEPGTYRGALVPPNTDTFDIVVEITVFDELYRGGLRVRADEELAETLVGMIPIDPPLKHSVWGPIFYGAAALVVIVATVVAIRRQRTGEEEEA